MKSRLLSAFLILVCLCAVAPAQTVSKIVPDGKPHKWEMKDHQFWVDGEKTMLNAGEMHFGRVVPEDWDTRIKQAKALGLNTISFYLFWHMVEKEEGKFTFTGMTDVRRVLKLCQDNGMWAVLRPGPYCCAETEYGGIPWWTVKYPDVKIRTTDPKWMEWSKRYIGAVYKEVADLQVSKGGPLVMIQLDNELGVINPPDYSYLVALNKVFKEVGFEIQTFTCDPTTKIWTDPTLRIPGVMHARNGLKDDQRYNQSKDGIGDYPVFVPEVYTAWFSGWGEAIATRNGRIQDIVNWETYLLDHGYSGCLYMFFGGTNYGYDQGANHYLPVQTSYDYNAPIDEAGRTTEKYDALRKLFAEKLKTTLPEPPANPLVIEIPAIKFDQKQSVLETLPSTPTRTAAKTLSMEEVDQGYGFINYRKKFANGLKGSLELKNVMDYAVVMVNGKTVGMAFRGYGPESSKIALPETAGAATLDIFIANLGRISVPTGFESQALARKGLIGGATLDGANVSDWEIFSLPLEKGTTNFKASTAAHTGPTFYRATFNLDKVGGTFLDMRNFGMGQVWVNGHNLGRFWEVGGLRSLFVPSHWLKAGQNEIQVLELHDAPTTPEIAGGTKIIETPAKPWKVKLDQY